MNHVPLNKDRLGFRRTRQGSEHALATGTAIPNNESILVLNWMRCDLGGTSTDHYIGVGPSETVGGERVSILRNGDDLKLGCNDGGWQQVTVPIPDSGDHLWGILVDRDGTLLDIYLDGTLVSSAALTNDPDLSANNQIQLNNSTGGANSRIAWTGWRGLIQTFANGSTPSQADMSEALKAMCSPDSAVHSTISSAVGSVYNDWNLGEGIYGATTITDNGTSSDDFTIQGGLTIEDISIRAMTPVRRPVQDWYTYLKDEGGAGAVRDYGLAVQPVVMRAHVTDLYNHSAGQTIINFSDNSPNNYIRLRTSAGVLEWELVANGGAQQVLPLEGDQFDGGDWFIVCNGTDVKIYLNGQHIGTLTLTDSLDFSGNCLYQDNNGNGTACRHAIWNPASIPVTMEEEIRACVMDMDVDPPSLGTPLVDFPLNATTLPLATTSVMVNQGSGGGAYVLSGQRQNVTRLLFAARS